jgi:hypothetical protein
MTLLLIAYLYKFQLKPNLGKIMQILKRPYLWMGLQPAEK